MSSESMSNLPLQEIYRQRFSRREEYRRQVWRAIIDTYCQSLIGKVDSILELGCGYGEFINQFRCAHKYAMDLNPDSLQYLSTEVCFLQHDCSTQWPLTSASLGAVFTSNFFEHLPDKAALRRTLREAYRSLKPGGKLVAIGPNIKCEPGRYWDTCDHYLPLTEASLAEFCRLAGFEVEREIARFLPWTMSNNRRYPIFFVHLYLRLPILWRVFGRQFLVVCRKPS